MIPFPTGHRWLLHCCTCGGCSCFGTMVLENPPSGRHWRQSFCLDALSPSEPAAGVINIHVIRHKIKQHKKRKNQLLSRPNRTGPRGTIQKRTRPTFERQSSQFPCLHDCPSRFFARTSRSLDLKARFRGVSCDSRRPQREDLSTKTLARSP